MNNKIAFCIIDNIHTYATDEIKSTIQNICDYTISNLYAKEYDVYMHEDEDLLLKSVKDYDFAVVMSPGTEYINGQEFFKSLSAFLQQDFFIAGHVLDRTMYNAYYELHHQCYVVNMNYYKKLKYPTVGFEELNSLHTQFEPARSNENWHDEYTPKYVMPGTNVKQYSHKCHGWNLLSLAFTNKLPVLVFDQNIRDNKKHYYPESEKDYYKQIEYIKQKLDYCENYFVHKTNTETKKQIHETYQQLVIPASGTLYTDCIDSGRIIFYDYNQCALDYWKQNIDPKEDIEYVFVKTDLLNDSTLLDNLDFKLKTFVNLSNVFCYEGTAAKYSLKERLLAQENIVSSLKKHIDYVDINFTLRADAGHSAVVRLL